jgi:glycine dehydrogenase subunit 1
MKAYIPSGPEDRQTMLDRLGLQDVMALFQDVPEDLLVQDLAVPDGMSEMDLYRHMSDLSKKNRVFSDVWRGAGAYRHYIPAVVRSIMAKERFITSYTPYQAEISQGILQSIFEYQTSICELTGMDVSNASLYDGGSALAEACRMAIGRKKNEVLLLGNIHPQVIEVVQSYHYGDDVKISPVEAGSDGLIGWAKVEEALTDQTAAICFQQPNFFGLIEDAPTLIAKAKEKKLKTIVQVNPATLGVLESPGKLGADIAVGEAQSLGLPLSFGGPYVGFLACKEDLKRQLPGRIVGQTVDAEGKRAFVLTLQAREQHIRREKASSNVCSNQALCAMQVNAYLAAMGPDGLRKQGLWSAHNAQALAGVLGALGFELLDDKPFFHEFRTSSPVNAYKLEKYLAKKGILMGLPLAEDEILWCATELNDQAALDRLTKRIQKYLEEKR